MKTKHKVLILFFLRVLAGSVYMMFTSKQSIVKAENEYEELQNLDIFINEEENPVEENDNEEEIQHTANARIDLATLKRINSDCIGWIQIPDTLVSYPIVAGDTVYYLKHTFRGTYSNAGSIFIDEQNSADLSDAHTIIYGHNMYSYGMFTDLENYVDYDYWKEHPYVYIWTRTGEHKYRIFSCYTAYDSDVAYTVGYGHDDVFGQLIEYMTVNSRYITDVEVSEEDNIITLSTCYNNKNIRYLVHAVQLY